MDHAVRYLPHAPRHQLSITDGPGAILPQPIAYQMVKPGEGGAGLGVFVNNVGLISHFGVNRGFRAVFGLPLNAGKALAVMTNGDNGALVWSISRLLSAPLPTDNEYI